jgi:5-methyltetrahydropteroyltriglutamate--homocysteine methyltransferase
MAQATNLGYPRIGTKRELKKALEHFWLGQLSETALLEQAAALRRHHWFVQQQFGLNHIPSNDFSLYDHVLDTIAMVGAVPARYHWRGTRIDLQTYFAMARGVGQDRGRSSAMPAMEMTKWFDTNYHYIVPEFEEGQQFFLASTRPLDEFLEARALGIHSRPVLLGPVSFLLPVYEEVIRQLTASGADWIQMDEPCLALDLDAGAQAAFQTAYARLAMVSPQARLLLATYFGDLRENLPLVLRLPVAAVHLDLVRAPQQLEQALPAVPPSLSLSLGVVDGRNVWHTGLDRALALIERGVQALGAERILVGPPAHCCMCRLTWRSKRASMRSYAHGSPSPTRKSKRSCC